jgi:hypothetical protein
MIDFVRITGVSDMRWAAVTACYRSAFPRDERRPVRDLEQMLAKKHFFANALLAGEDTAGLLFWWQLDHFRYLEHFAVAETFRGNGTGREALRLFLRESSLPVIIETEPPSDRMSCRRVDFYESEGFVFSPESYLQPPYSDGRQAVELRLAEWGGNLLDAGFENVKTMIYQQIYGV